jgi:hypothetical protein
LLGFIQPREIEVSLERLTYNYVGKVSRNPCNRRKVIWGRPVKTDKTNKLIVDKLGDVAKNGL